MNQAKKNNPRPGVNLLTNINGLLAESMEGAPGGFPEKHIRLLLDNLRLLVDHLTWYPINQVKPASGILFLIYLRPTSWEGDGFLHAELADSVLALECYLEKDPVYAELYVRARARAFGAASTAPPMGRPPILFMQLTSSDLERWAVGGRQSWS